MLQASLVGMAIRLGMVTTVAHVASKASSIDIHQKSQTSVVTVQHHDISMIATYTMRDPQKQGTAVKTKPKEPRLQGLWLLPFEVSIRVKGTRP